MTAPYYADDAVTLHHGDCLDVLRTLPDASVDAVVTDPPYDLTAGKKGGTGKASVNLDSPYGRSRISTGNGGFMGKDWDATGIAFDPETWREVLRVLKPGGHMLAFGGSRTWHRLAVAVEDAGFEIRDSIAWLYGSGFPKSLDVSKAIDKAAGAEREVVGHYVMPPGSTSAGYDPGNKASGWRNVPNVDGGPSRLITAPATAAATQWQGWGTALKPAFEPIVVGRKPLPGTVAANVLEHGTGALNIDACRTATSDNLGGGAEKITTAAQKGDEGWVRPWMSDPESQAAHAERVRANVAKAETLGRWPTNVVLDESQAAELDKQTGVSVSRIGQPRGAASGEGWGMTATGAEYADSGGASRFFPVFRYEAKAPTSERPTSIQKVLRLREDITPEQADHVRARLREAGVEID